MQNWNPYEQSKNKTVMAFSNPIDTKFIESKSIEQLEEEGYFEGVEEEDFYSVSEGDYYFTEEEEE